MYSTISLVLVILATGFCDTDKIGEACTSEIYNGTCIKVIECPYVLKLITLNDLDNINKVKCGFEGLNPKVCCPKGEVPILYNVVEEVATNRPKPSSKVKPTVTTTFAPPLIKQTDKIFPNKTVCGKNSGVSERIVGGTITQVDEHPWLARIRYKIDDEERFACSASLITDRYLITAAHCVQKKKPISIRLGEWNTKTEKDCYNEVCNEQTIDVNISEINIHPGHQIPMSMDGDIALLKLEQPVTFTDFIQPICLPTSDYIALQDYSPDSAYIAAGWGETEYESESVVKRQVELNAASIEICRNIYQLTAESEPNIICAGGTKGKDTCKGDSGGPLIKLVPENYEINWYLYGITSLGTPRCGSEGVPGLYTRVSAYMNWIREVVSK